MITHVYLSPHLDDVVFSVGGIIHRQAQAGERVSVVTVCAGDPPPGPLSFFAQSLHTRWETPTEAVAVRRAEDQAALNLLGAEVVHLTVPDCIYRTRPATGEHLYTSEAALFGELNPAEQPLAERIAQELAAMVHEHEPAQVYAPLGIGRHVDHQLTRQAAEQLGRSLVYMEDYPYAAWYSEADAWGGLARALTPVWTTFHEADLEAQCRAVLAYRSQFSSFWADEGQMRADLRRFAERVGQGALAVRLWR